MKISFEPWTRVFSPLLFRRRRIDLGLSKTEVGLMMGFSEGSASVFISRMEAGYAFPQWKTVWLICEALHCDVERITMKPEDVISGKHLEELEIDLVLYDSVDSAETYRFKSEIENIKRRLNERQRRERQSGYYQTENRWKVWNHTEEGEESETQEHP